jgi:hypothetical protein
MRRTVHPYIFVVHPNNSFSLLNCVKLNVGTCIFLFLRSMVHGGRSLSLSLEKTRFLQEGQHG